MFFKKVNEQMRMDNPVKWYILSIVRAIIIGLLTVAIFVGGFLLIATLAEYKPAEREEITVAGVAESLPADKTELTVLTWNLGYAALGEEADFFMDGGASVRAGSQEQVETNLDAIVNVLRETDADVSLLQEVDRDSSRSFRVNEVERLQSEFPAQELLFANNYKFFWIPFPLPTTIGKVDAGLVTLSKHKVETAERIALACPFSWPMRTMNMKRCLLVTRVALPDTEKELVLINLHMEAYDDGTGRAAQMAELKEVMDAEAAKGNYVLAGGDFNEMFSTVTGDPYPAQPNTWIAPLLDVRPYTDDWQFLMDPSVPTCRLLNQPYKDADKESFQYYMLDGFIVSNNLEVESLETKDLGFVNSDHNPVVLKVRLS